MSIILVTGAAGLIGSESVRFFAGRGFTVVGIDNNMRQFFLVRMGQQNGTAIACYKIMVINISTIMLIFVITRQSPKYFKLMVRI
jgi:nucleoside-diphosphate-sugar epimerase